MRLSTLLSGFLLFASLASASTLPYVMVGTAPCLYLEGAATVTTGGITYDAVGPVGSSFQCGSLDITNISGVAGMAVNIEGEDDLPDKWLFTVDVDPINAALGWSYAVRFTSVDSPLLYPLLQVKLPALNHVTSGSPTVTEHFCSAPCTGDNDDVFGQQTVGTDLPVITALSFFDGPVYVAVLPGDINGGAISGLDTSFITPEPVSGILLASGLLGLVLYGRKRSRSASRITLSVQNGA